MTSLILPRLKSISPSLLSCSTQSFHGPYHQLHSIIVISVHTILKFMYFESSNDLKAFLYAQYILYANLYIAGA